MSLSASKPNGRRAASAGKLAQREQARKSWTLARDAKPAKARRARRKVDKKDPINRFVLFVSRALRALAGFACLARVLLCFSRASGPTCPMCPQVSVTAVAWVSGMEAWVARCEKNSVNPGISRAETAWHAPCNLLGNDFVDEAQVKHRIDFQLRGACNPSAIGRIQVNGLCSSSAANCGEQNSSGSSSRSTLFLAIRTSDLP